jgi:hypothetical protein
MVETRAFHPREDLFKSLATRRRSQPASAGSTAVVSGPVGQFVDTDPWSANDASLWAVAAGATVDAATAGSSAEDGPAEDGVTPDTAAEDGVTPDTAAEDGVTPDTATPDTAAPDTAASVSDRRAMALALVCSHNSLARCSASAGTAPAGAAARNALRKVSTDGHPVSRPSTVCESVLCAHGTVWAMRR